MACNSEESKMVTEQLKLLAKFGYIKDINIKDADIQQRLQSRAAKLYHNTEALFKNYRKACWAINAKTIDILKENNIAQDNVDLFSKNINKLLEAVNNAENSVNEPRYLNSAMQTTDTSNEMLERANLGMALLKTYINGEELYSIIYYTYVSNDLLIGSHVKPETVAKKLNISLRKYFNERKEALKLMSTVIWGTSDKELEALTRFSILTKGY